MYLKSWLADEQMTEKHERRRQREEQLQKTHQEEAFCEEEGTANEVGDF